jgi:hypothetical protein
MLRAVAGQALRLAAWTAGFYLLALAATLLAFPPADDAGPSLATGDAPKTLYRTAPKYVVLNRAPLLDPPSGPNVVLVGASNVEVGFSPREVERTLAADGNDAAVHNLAVGGANVTETAEVVDLLLEAAPPERHRDLTVAIGLWFGLFTDDRQLWPDRPTDIDVERFRYGLYRKDGASGAIEPVLPVRWLPAAALLVRPFLALDVLVKGNLAALRVRLVGRPHDVAGPTPPPLDEEGRRARSLAFWRNYVGTDGALSDEQFERLDRLVRRLSEAGVRVLLVDLPLPQWHARRSPYYADYQQRKRRWIDAALATTPNVRYASLQDLSNDADYIDEVHPTPEAARRWVRRLVDALTDSGEDAAASGRIAVRSAPAGG